MTNAGKRTWISRYISAVIRWRLCILALWSAGVMASAFVYLSNFRIDNSVAIWFLEDGPELEAYRYYNAEFGKNEWTYVWLRGDSVFSPEFLRDLRLLRDRIESFENVTRVLSLTEARGILVGPDGEPGLDEFYAVGAGELPSVEQAVALREKIRGNPRFQGKLVAPDDDRFTIMAIENANHIDSIEPYRIRMIDKIRDAASSYSTVLDFGIVGTTVVNSELNRAARRDMLIYYSLIGAFVFLGGGLSLGRARDLVVLCAVVLGTILPIMGCIAALGLSFNLMTVMLPTLLVTVSVSYLIHFISEFHSTRREHEERDRHRQQPDTSAAISATFAQLLLPGLWTSVTTVVGFASLTLSPVAPIRHIGCFAAAGVGLAWINTITIAPALLNLLWINTDSLPLGNTRKEKRSPLLDWLAHPRPILAMLLGIAILAGAFGLVRQKADTDYVKFFRPGSTVRNDYAQLHRLGLPGSYLTVMVRLPENTNFTDIGRHREMRRFERSLRVIPGVIDIQSLDRTVEQFASDLSGADASRTPDPLLENLLVKAASGQLGETSEFLADDGHLIQLQVMTGPMSTLDINEFRGELEDLTADQPEAWRISLIGTNVLWANMDAQVVRTQLLSIGITAAVLFVLLPLVFRSLVLGILGFVVSFVPVLCTLGLMAWLELPINIATCILGGVVIGLAIDDTIYFLSRVREGMLLGMQVDEAARQATWTTGRAMIKTSIILTGGFLTMAASDFMPSVYFGIFFGFSIIVALLADLIVLPVLLRLAQPLLKQARQR